MNGKAWVVATLLLIAMPAVAVLATPPLSVLDVAGVVSIAPVGDDDPANATASTGDGGRSRYQATIVDIASIDTITVRRDDGRELRVRLAGVAPLPIDVRDCRPRSDVSSQSREAAEEGHPPKRERSTRLVPAAMRPGREIVVEEAERSRRRPASRTPTVYAAAEDGHSLNAELIRGGWAAVESGRYAASDRFRRLEATARSRGWGAWRCRESTERAGGIAAGDPGDLGILRVASAGNASRDRVMLWNRRDRRLDFGGWRLRTEDGDSYRFPDGFNLIGRGKVTVTAGDGRSTPHHVYMGRFEPFVGRSDTVRLVHPDGTIADRWDVDGADEPAVEIPLREELPVSNVADRDPSE